MMQSMAQAARILLWDFRLQYRYYFWTIALVVGAMWSGVLFALPEDIISIWLPMVIFADLSTIGVMFITGILYLERRQGTIYATAVMPASAGTWLSTKLFSLSLLCLACVIIIVLFTSNSVNWFRLIPAVVLTAATFASVGFLVAVQFDKLLNYFFAIALVFIPLNLPALDYFGIFSNEAMWLIPSEAAIWALAGSFQEMETSRFLGYLVLLILWLAVTHWLGIRAFRKFIATRQQL